MQLYLAATPEHIEPALALTCHLAHAAFRIGEDGALLARTLPPTLRGGLMVVQCDAPFPAAAAPELGREILRTCLRRSFSGIVLDGFTQPSPELRALCAQLDTLAPRYDRRLYVPPACAGDAPGAAVLLCTALSGGTLQTLLEDAVDRFGAERIALDLQRLRMEFPLPCPSGEGKPLTAQELTHRMQGRSVYYCDALCARYFTCRRGSETRFVLFDDADTLRRKVEQAESLGIGVGFLMWPEVEDIAGEFFEQKKEGEP